MAKVLRFKDVNSDVDRRMKEFEKMRTKLKLEIQKSSMTNEIPSKNNKGILKSITTFFSDSPASSRKMDERKFNSI